MKQIYNCQYQPPFLEFHAEFTHPDTGAQNGKLNALLDTGSDGSLVPIKSLREILAPPASNASIRNHWRGWRSIQRFVVDLKFEEFVLPEILMVGDEQGNEVVLGRNVLNKLRLLLDGPVQFTELVA